MKLFEKLLFEPDSKIYTQASDYQVLPEVVTIVSGQETLHGWWFSAKEPRAVLIQFHGNAENLTSHAPYVAWLAEFGISVFCFDYAGYGKSSGRPSIAQVRLDTDAALKFAHKKSVEIGKPLICLGQSIGSQFGLSALARAVPAVQSQLIILEGAFPSIRSLVRSRLPRSFPVNLCGALIANLFPRSEDASHSIPKLNSKFLIIHSKSDQIVSLELGYQVLNLVDERLRDLWVVDGPRHLKTLTSDYPEMRKYFLHLIGSELSKS